MILKLSFGTFRIKEFINSIHKNSFYDSKSNKIARNSNVRHSKKLRNTVAMNTILKHRSYLQHETNVQLAKNEFIKDGVLLYLYLQYLYENNSTSYSFALERLAQERRKTINNMVDETIRERYRNDDTQCIESSNSFPSKVKRSFQNFSRKRIGALTPFQFAY